ncbi:MAG TPA: LON peptidase substrate-binding domain-containing protein [Ignavibacteria bacterium]|nr:LON peptidase substrate-binding domain-containing protein [Ignavibacteria bacterium]
MSEEIEIPLFPLNVVMYPHSKIPLYIFEERYKKMIGECISGGTVFGINFYSEKNIHITGCSAEVSEITERLENGGMNIIVNGVQRYKIINYELTLSGYYTGKIEYLDDEIGEYDKVKMEKAVKIYNDLVEIVYKGSVKKIDLSEVHWFEGNRSVAFTMAEKSGLSLAERQSLLETDKEDERLDYMLKYFESIMPKIKEADKISNIIKSDGYIQQ